MRFRFDQFVLVCGIFAVVGNSASGQSLNSRLSQLTYTYVYGAGGDTHVGNDLIEDNLLVESDNEHTDFSGSTAGVLPGDPERPYTAGVSIDLDHEYTIVGPYSSFRSIIASGTTDLTSSVSGFGSATTNSSSPGNHLIFYFTVDHPVEYDLSGAVASTEPSFATAVALQRFDGFAWQYVFYSAFLPGSQGVFDASGVLSPGEYRILGSIGQNTFASESHSASYNYTLTLTTEGDMNCDGRVDGLDVQGFVLALLDGAAYDAAYPECSALNGDMNDNGSVTLDDIPAFVTTLLP